MPGNSDYLKQRPLTQYYEKPVTTDGTESNPNVPVYDGARYAEQHPSTGYQQSRPFLEQHPALQAIDVTKKHKMYAGTGNTDTPDTPDTIRVKEQQLSKYFPTVNMSVNDLHKYLSSWSSTDPSRFNTVMKLASDIKTFYEGNRQLKGQRFPRNAGRAVNETLNPWSKHIDDVYELAVMITRVGNGSLATGPLAGASAAINGGKGNMSQAAAQNTFNQVNTAAANVAGYDGKSLLDYMATVKDAYDKELKFNMSLPNAQGAYAAKAASEKRLDAYETVYGMCNDRYTSFYRTNDINNIIMFLQAYLANPLEPLDSDERSVIYTYIQQLGEQKTAKDAAAMTFKSMSVYNKYKIGGNRG